MLAQSIYVDVQVVLCSIFRSVSPAPGTPNFTGPVKRARPDSVLGTAPPFLQGNNVAELSQMALDVVRPSFARFFNQKSTGKYKKKLIWEYFLYACTRYARILFKLNKILAL